MPKQWTSFKILNVKLPDGWVVEALTVMRYLLRMHAAGVKPLTLAGSFQICRRLGACMPIFQPST